jgi:hypothetical protein
MADSIITTCGLILDAVAADAAVNAYVVANFGTGATLSKYLGADVQDLPKEGSLPALWAIPTAFGRSDDFDHDEAAITIGVAIKKEGKTATANYTKLDGYTLLVGLSGLVAVRIETVLSGNMLQLSDISMDVDYPYFKATWSFRVPESA